MILPSGIEIKILTEAEFNPLWNKYSKEIFDDQSQVFRVFNYLSSDEKEKMKTLQGSMGHPFQLCLGIYYEGHFAGWSFGLQESAETYYMKNSAILPQYRRKGLYSTLLKQTLEILKEKGFQKIYSRHSASNNDVIIPKLKAGFLITSMEISDMFGILVHLTIFTKELRKKMLIYRVGDIKPDTEIKECLGI